MYERLRPFEKTNDLPRLPGPEATAPRRNPIAVSVAPVEVPLVMERFPIAWRRDGASWDLVALTGLTPEQESWRPAIGDSGGRVVPLLLRAYPLALHDDTDLETLGVLVDEDGLAETATGLDPDAVDEALTLRLQALWTYAQSRRALAAAFAEMASAGAFRPWGLGFSRPGQSIALQGFFHVDKDYMGSPAHHALVARHGWLVAQLITLHRVSLHRVNGLLRDLVQARAA